MHANTISQDRLQRTFAQFGTNVLYELIRLYWRSRVKGLFSWCFKWHVVELVTQPVNILQNIEQLFYTEQSCFHNTFSFPTCHTLMSDQNLFCISFQSTGYIFTVSLWPTGDCFTDAYSPLSLWGSWGNKGYANSKRGRHVAYYLCLSLYSAILSTTVRPAVLGGQKGEGKDTLLPSMEHVFESN